MDDWSEGGEREGDHGVDSLLQRMKETYVKEYMYRIDFIVRN